MTQVTVGFLPNDTQIDIRRLECLLSVPDKKEEVDDD